MALRGSNRLHGEKARTIYRPFAERLKTHSDDLSWIMTLPVRAEIVNAYEGPERAEAWLQELARRMAPPDDGIVSLLLGRIHMAQGQLPSARKHLSQAVTKSLTGIEWYRLEALNYMLECLAQLGENRLAFEYARTHSIESYKLGRIKGADLYEAINGLSLIFGQIDYIAEVKKNLALKAREKSDFTRAALHEADAGFRLAQMGAREEGASSLVQAARDASLGSHPGDPFFAATCRLLARYLDQTPIGGEEIQKLLQLTSQWGSFPFGSILKETSVLVRDNLLPGAQLLDEWQSLCKGYGPSRGLTAREREGVLILIHLAALLGRFYQENDATAHAEAFFDAVTSVAGVRDAIFLFSREDYAEALIREGKASQALRVCETLLAQESSCPHERFVYRQLAARCNLALGRNQEAYVYAQLALADWKRVLEGLYSEKHKVSWIERGAPCLSCALEAIRAPVPWMPDPERFREIFSLIELGKARLVTDMVSHQGYLPGVYLLPESRAMKKDVFKVLRQEHPEWYPPVILQTAVYSEGMSTMVHDESGRVVKNFFLDVTPLRGVIQLPMEPEKRLFATAGSLAYEEPPNPARGELYDDLIRITRPSSGGPGN
jgi:tetratricopeptide (TPR) repeat protein